MLKTRHYFKGNWYFNINAIGEMVEVSKGNYQWKSDNEVERYSRWI